MSEETKAAFENMKFYKFYPVQTDDTPDISNVKVQLFSSSFFFLRQKIILLQNSFHKKVH